MKPHRLSRAAGEMLLRLIEQPQPVALRSVLNEWNASAADELIKVGALVSDGFATCIALDGDDGRQSVDLDWDPIRRAYVYFDAATGFVAPHQDEISLFRVDMSWWLRWLAEALDLVGASKPTELVDAHAWDVGDFWIGSNHKVPLIFARRLRNREVAAALTIKLNERSGRSGGILLIGRNDGAAYAPPARHRIFVLQKTLAADARSFAVDKALLTARTSA